VQVVGTDFIPGVPAFVRNGHEHVHIGFVIAAGSRQEELGHNECDEHSLDKGIGCLATRSFHSKPP